jgi:glycosyltransferase involved in cell wall biosynthesis
MTRSIESAARGTSARRLIRRALRRPARFVRRQVLPRVMPPAQRTGPTQPRNIHVVGLMSSASGIGKSARLCAQELMRDGFCVSTADVASLFASNDEISYPTSRDAPIARGGFAVYHLNPPMLLPGIVRAGLGAYYRSYNIGYWAWELESLPPEWISALDFVHAVIVPSRFCQTAVQRYTDKPVLVVPHPVPDTPGRTSSDRTAQPFLVLNIFRFGSSFARKNPIALVRAFREAFANDPETRLLLKTSDGARYPAERDQLMRETEGASNIEVVDQVMDEARMAAVMRSADVYASLHRSEGFGLPLAEAIMNGVPVVATNWSGNVDFCSPDGTYPVDCTLVPFEDTHPDYEQVAGAVWAEPVVAHAAAQLRRIRDRPAEAQRKARHAKRALLQHLEANSYKAAMQVLADVTARAPA